MQLTFQDDCVNIPLLQIAANRLVCVQVRHGILSRVKI